MISKPVPHRNTSSWPGFGRASDLPIRYGDASGECVPADASGVLWCWAGHACAIVSNVIVDGVAVQGFIFANAADSSGSVVCYVTLSELASGVVVVAIGRGKIG